MQGRPTRLAIFIVAFLLSACASNDVPTGLVVTPTAATTASPSEHILLVLDRLDRFYDRVEALAPLITDTTAMSERAALSADAIELVRELRGEFDWLPTVDIPESVRKPYFELLDAHTVFPNLLGYEELEAWDSGWHVINMQVPDLRRRVVEIRALADELP
jgi:hypothetical protein